MQKSVDTIMRSLQASNEWISEMKNEMQWQDDHKAFEALKCALQTFRDRLTPDEAAHLGAQLPMVLRGAYYEGWKPAAAPQKWRTRDEFFAPIRNHFRNDSTVDPEKVTMAMWDVMCHHVTPGELRDVYEMMPEQIRSMLPSPTAT